MYLRASEALIIGAKIAAEVLKERDMVEVDANNGIVRKIA